MYALWKVSDPRPEDVCQNQIVHKLSCPKYLSLRLQKIDVPLFIYFTLSLSFYFDHYLPNDNPQVFKYLDVFV